MNRPVRQQVQPRGYKPTFAAFLADRGTRKPSTPTMKAYRHDFDTIAERIVGSDEGVKAMSLSNITTEAMRTAFAQYAEITKRPPSSDAGRRGTCCAASPSPSLPVRRRLHGTRGSPNQPKRGCGAGLLMRRADWVVGAEIGRLSGGHSVLLRMH